MSKKLEWEKIPQKYRYLTKEVSGHWYFHIEEPAMDLTECAWFSDDMYRAHWLYGRLPNRDWKKSLVVRTFNAEYHKPTVDWSRVDDHYDWIATNEDGETFAYSERPDVNCSVKGDGFWGIDYTQRALWIHGEECDYRPGTCGWKHSLLERPNRTTRIKPSINWVVVPDKFRWLATDMDGESWLYQNQPEIDDNRRWVDPIGAGCCPVTNRDDMFIGRLPWYDSLVERPA